MITIIQNRGTGKTKKLLEIANKNNAAILTSDKRALKVKAQSYNLDDSLIYDYEDLENDIFPIGAPIYIHSIENLISYLMDRYYGVEIEGFTATSNE